MSEPALKDAPVAKAAKQETPRAEDAGKRKWTEEREPPRPGDVVYFWVPVSEGSTQLKPMAAMLIEPSQRDEKLWHLKLYYFSFDAKRRSVPYSAKPKNGCWSFRD
jgi:hypothetical protein